MQGCVLGLLRGRVQWVPGARQPWGSEAAVIAVRPRSWAPVLVTQVTKNCLLVLMPCFAGLGVPAFLRSGLSAPSTGVASRSGSSGFRSSWEGGQQAPGLRLWS